MDGSYREFTLLKYLNNFLQRMGSTVESWMGAVRACEGLNKLGSPFYTRMAGMGFTLWSLFDHQLDPPQLGYVMSTIRGPETAPENG